MKRIILSNATRLNQFYRYSSSVQSSVILNYGPEVPVSVPLIRDVISYPKPPIHKDHKEVRRLHDEWALKFWDNQEIRQRMLNDDWPYLTGFKLAQVTQQEYLNISKMLTTIATSDFKAEYQYTDDDRQRAFNKITKMVATFLTKKPSAAVESLADEIPTMDSMQLMAMDLFQLIFDQYKPVINFLIPMATGFLKHDLKAKKDESFFLPFDEFIKIRQATFFSRIAVFGLLYLTGNRTGDWRRHQMLYKVPQFRRFADSFEMIMMIANEIQSFKSEQARNDHWGNAVTILARQNSTSLQEGIEDALKILDDKITEFQTLGWQLVNSPLVEKFPKLSELVDVAFPNMAYGYVHNADSMGKYKVDGDDVTDVEENPEIGTRIDPQLVFERVVKMG